MADDLHTSLERTVADFRSDSNDSLLSKHGVEGDARIWFIKLRLRGHQKEFTFEIPASEYRRLFSAIQHEEEDGLSFVVFDSISHQIAVNLSELVYCHFLFEARTAADKEHDSSEVRVYFCGNNKPLSFGVDPDEGNPDDEDDSGEFRQIFLMLDTYAERHDRFSFTDSDGEDVFLRVGDIALFEVPLWVVEAESHDEDEDDSADAEA